MKWLNKRAQQTQDTTSSLLQKILWFIVFALLSAALYALINSLTKT